ncbi:MAG: response regulator transcription factor [Clostridia bacterium]|nr:response regulator transcription factor [Clostridia bacterium]
MKVLYAEDEKHLSKVIAAILTHNGCEVDAVYDGGTALEYAMKNEYDILVLDVMMPVMSGIDAMKKIRDAGIDTPIIMLTAKAELEDRINGLDAGANDYLTKPFASEELLARMRAQTRMLEKTKQTIYSVGNVVVDTAQLEIKNDDSALRLNNMECTMLTMLISEKGYPITSKTFYHKIWNDVGDELIVRMYISYINKKLKSLNANVYVEEDNGYFLKELSQV